ncbi:Uu.00g003810.m01.CDS01 [Anthostomella pinea]|uniref:Uu.00g003810.m01.CDS01 n=1 Tax=Anthostomella pinea TaxID=933095 RepID=A0AAI8VKT1_9PEZI|nr:Uu.00g003810.m01.CDS01 [Anthostomella pinea]
MMSASAALPSADSAPPSGPVHLNTRVGPPLTRELSLYNGISNRSRGWKTRKSERAMEPSSSNPCVMRWDGASRSSATWDNLRRDPELWFRHGNCYVHLYGQGQSRRGPAFRVPFAALLEANCYPLIDRFMSQDISKPSGQAQRDDHEPASYFSRSQRHSRIELFIPAPPHSDKHQAYNYHLATRNFFAFIFRRSMVGESLGSALITLMHSLHEFRTEDVDIVQDMKSYLDEEGYLHLKTQPSHALAILHLAEVFQLRELYIDAFAHCCGMSDQLFLGPEYQLLTSVTRKLIRRARVEMDLRLGQSGRMLRTFLQDELSEAYLGLYPGARAHLERFRTLLHGLYAARFGYYPPASIDPRTTVFEVDVFRTMRTDFEALYQYLVDESFDTSHNSPFLAQGGICTLQSVQSFDTRHNFQTLYHPLPLLPQVAPQSTSSRKVAWLSKQMKATQAQRANTHTALLKATNQGRGDLLNNELVRAYRKFEEDSTFSPIKADKLENLGPMDARKVRWILVYAVYQTLRQATEPPAEVKDATDVPYNVCISTTHLPPWKEERPVRTLVRRQSDQMITRNPSTSTAGRSSKVSTPPPPSTPTYEIKPDIDYFALVHQPVTESKDRRTAITRRISRTESITRSLSRNSTVRRSIGFLRKQQPETMAHHHPLTPCYHEIVIKSYGNGTNDAEDITPTVRTPRKTMHPMAEVLPRLSTSDESADSSNSYNSEGASSQTSNTSGAASPTESFHFSWDSRPSSVCVCGPKSHAHAEVPNSTHPDIDRSPTLHQDNASGIPSISLPFQRRPNSVHCGALKIMEPLPLNIRKANTFAPDLSLEMPSPRTPTSWDYIKAVMEVKATNMLDEIHPEWEQYTDLGGHTPIKSAVTTPDHSIFKRNSFKRASTMY